VGCTISGADEGDELSVDELIVELIPTLPDGDEVPSVDGAALEVCDPDEAADDEKPTMALEEDELTAAGAEAEEDEAGGLDDKATDDDPLEATELLESITLLDAVLPVHFPNPT
jgi:hypothetical protein